MTVASPVSMKIFLYDFSAPFKDNLIRYSDQLIFHTMPQNTYYCSLVYAIFHTLFLHPMIFSYPWVMKFVFQCHPAVLNCQEPNDVVNIMITE